MASKSTRRARDGAEMARLTFLIEPALKDALVRLCLQQDLTTSQLLRRLVGDTIRPRPASRVKG